MKAARITAVVYPRARSYTVVFHVGRSRIVVRLWRRDFEQLLRRRADVTIVRRHRRGMTLKLGPNAAWEALVLAAGDVRTTVAALVRLLRAEREHARFLKMWGVEGGWGWVPVVIRPWRVRSEYAGAYHSLVGIVEICTYHVMTREHAIMVLLHELGHRAVRLVAGRDGLGERIAPPVAALGWWSNKEELVCELGVAIALGRGRIERGAMVAMARRIAGMSREEAAALWRHTRWGRGPRAIGITWRGLVIAAN